MDITMPMQLLLVAAGGALGAVSRYLVVAWTTEQFGNLFPYGTLTVNVVGSFFIGLMFVLIVEKMHIQAHFKFLFMVGFLGAFTTFSTFSLETFSLIESGKLLTAVTYIVTSVILCVFATGLSVWAARAILR